MVTLAMLANLETRFERLVSRLSDMPDGATNDATLRVMAELGALLSQVDRVDAAIDDVKRPIRSAAEPAEEPSAPTADRF